MKLIQRVGYYLGGFSIGLIILAFFLNGKKTSCSYGPDARVLKNIRLKKIIYSDNIQSDFKLYNIDSVAINHILKKGSINFSESNARQKPCGIYNVEGEFEEKEIILIVENCDSIATITNLKIE
ncbi:hypothetical protein [Flavivirga rizhaonensis]|uniref:DUF4258 domain-containing protein n=1 Tax=Flavivirga rizhaonensis TaxID=2559571 RepID=A0A4S1E1Y2_9FLAO|nr:hypothetical protein [Flavivirga rizhaonensis]TGV03968.1 hypothetical protein EM932_04010 [Flavivirga rizhaonensis]